jgi:hypothetical protein
VKRNTCMHKIAKANNSTPLNMRLLMTVKGESFQCFPLYPNNYSQKTYSLSIGPTNSTQLFKQSTNTIKLNFDANTKLVNFNKMPCSIEDTKWFCQCCLNGKCEFLYLITRNCSDIL